MFKVCPQCNYLYDGKKWFRDDELLQKLTRHNEVEKLLCTACKRIRDKIACGIIYLSADFLKQKQGEVMKMIRKEEELEQSKNHLSRILRTYWDNNKLVVETINQQLAVHIGKKMKKMYGGHLEITGGQSGHYSRGKDDREEVIVKWFL